MIGQTISHYKITEKLGEGGMGVVYKAEDTKLRRTVALKFPPIDKLAGEEEKARFVREAQAAAALNHPNICTVYEIGEDAGHTFIAMEFVDGQSVREKARARPLPLDEALDIAIQAAQGLQAAHENDVVHRDVKSANLMLTATGRVKVMDFGLAQVGDRSQLTKTGSTLGTTAYMSPEQALAQPTDRRTDIWSLGVVLYEMLTGRLPFAGEVEAAVAYAVVNTEPEPPTALRSGLPIEIDHVIDKALAKDREDRYQHVEDLLVDLRALRKGALKDVQAKARPRRRSVVLAGAGVVAALLVLSLGLNVGRVRDWIFAGPGSGPIASIAVLPLQNLSGDPEQEYFADGITEALITELGKIGALRVISRTSVMQYKGTQEPLPEIARALNVDALVAGSVLREADRVRITAQLIDAATDQHLWAESYERDLSSVLALQSEVARAIAQEIEVTLSPDEEARLANTREVNPEVYEAYLRGTYYLNQGTPESMRKGLGYLREAIEKDPADPLAYAGLALGYSLSASHGPWAPEEAFTLAKGAAMQALKLDDTLAEAHAALAQIRLYRDWDWPGAEQAFQRALELNPSLPAARTHYAMYLALFGRHDEAVTEIERAHQLDPLNPLLATWIGDVHWAVGEHDKAIQAFQRVLEQHPDFPWALRMLGFAYDGKGMYEEAIAVHGKVAASNPGMKWALAYSYALAGRRDEARKMAAEIEEGASRRKHYNLAKIYTALGETDEAFRRLEAAYENRSLGPWFRGTPPFKPLRGDPRFHDLLRQHFPIQQ